MVTDSTRVNSSLLRETPNKDTSELHAEATYTIVGEAPYAETQGERKTWHEVFSGLVTRHPLIKPYLRTIDALAVAWLSATEGQGVADVLFGDHPFNGTLPRRLAHG
ncbi:hypothetical protein IGI04_010077 [Brassica rapa subsp. trilocularis]|uniref:Uncharacterized protein n=1 Tax=Brassica rapa subsp. trilocularis TaxID=1813537 RepID=A0ABQ7MZ48_BRACM|nr:hypothetical protein IGI04_010077 [Brassica rapa subsp. trilocularis]